MNKTIWMFWEQGWENAPKICNQCVKSWKYYNPEWEVKTLDSKSIVKYIPDVYNKYSKFKISKAALSDIIRIKLLAKFGGIWCDATLFCNKPLDDWLPKETFLFQKIAANPYFISSWFISKGKDNYITSKMLKSTIEYWKDREKPHKYYWFHSLFEKLCKTDETFKAKWDATPHIMQTGPVLFLQYRDKFSSKYKWNRTYDEIIEQIDSKIDPVYKLTWRLYPDENTPGHYLLNNIKINYDE